MPSRLACFVLAGLLALLPPPAGLGQEAPEYRVIVHQDHPADSISPERLEDIFLKRTTRWTDGSRTLPVDQPVGALVRDVFSRAVLGRSSRSIAAHWQQQIFSGRGVPPPELADEGAVLGYVASRPGAIGYVSDAAPLQGVKVLEVLEVGR